MSRSHHEPADHQGEQYTPEPEHSLPGISDAAWSSATGKWVDSWIRNSPIANDVGAWNRLNEVLPKLKELLEAELNTPKTRE